MSGVEIKAKIGWAFLRLVGHLPLSFLYKVGDFAAWFMRVVLSYRKAVVYTNLARSFPGKPYEEINQIAKDFYIHLGEVIAETIWFAGCKGRPERLRKQNLYTYTNVEMLIRAREERGVICMKAHTGNWEVLGAIFEFNHGHEEFEKSFTPENFYVSYRAMRNPVSDRIFQDNRRAVLHDYHGLVEDTKLLRHAIMRRNERPVYVFIADQYPYLACHHVGTFLNQPTEAMLGGFGLAEKLGFGLLYIREKRLSRGHYSLTFEEITDNAAGKNPEEMMRKFYDLLEADIKDQPSNWLWSHKRWHY